MRSPTTTVAGRNSVEGVEAHRARSTVVSPKGMSRPVIDEVVVRQRVRAVRERCGGEAIRGD